MKKLLAGILVIWISVAFASAVIVDNSLLARSEGSQIQLYWKTGTESNLRAFAIERKTVNGNFIQIAEISPRGSNSEYSYVDDNLYKAASSVFVYRVKIIDNNESYAYSKELTVSHSPSDIKRTWGSIKAMFR